MNVISIVNHKGGVGKTTVTLNLGAELARRGHKVLLIDLDSQGNLSDAAGVDKAEKTIAEALDDLMEDRAHDPESFIYPTSLEEAVDIVPCAIDMAEAKLKMNLFLARERLLNSFIEEIRKKRAYDYILIDNAPSIDVDFQNALVASDHVLIVTEADKFSANGTESLLRQLYRVQKYFNPDLKVSGILINKADMRTNIARGVTESMRKVYGQVGGIRIFDTVIPQTVKLKEAVFYSASLREYEGKNPAAQAFSLFTAELEASIKEQEVYHG